MNATKTLLSLVPAFLLLVSQAQATSVICPKETGSKFEVGAKDRLRFKIGDDGSRGLETALRTFAIRHQLLFEVSPKADIAGSDLATTNSKALYYLTNDAKGIGLIVTEEGGDEAQATISTSSFFCSPPSDWRPYWSNFKKFVREHDYKPRPIHFISH